VKLSDRQTDRQTPGIIDHNSPRLVHLTRPDSYYEQYKLKDWKSQLAALQITEILLKQDVVSDRTER